MHVLTCGTVQRSKNFITMLFRSVCGMYDWCVLTGWPPASHKFLTVVCWHDKDCNLTMVKLTMPHSNRPLSCTVTPFSSWSCCLSIPAICCTLCQIASMPISSTYSAATPSPICNITPSLVKVDVFWAGRCDHAATTQRWLAVRTESDAQRYGYTGLLKQDSMKLESPIFFISVGAWQLEPL